MKKGLFVLLVVALVAVLVCPAFAQRAGREMGPMYDVQNESTIKGTVVRTEPTPGKMGKMGKGMETLVIKTDKGEERVLLGPKSYLEQQNYTFKPGESVEVTGSQYSGRNKHKMFMTREIRSGNNVMTFRDQQGMPSWRGTMGKSRKQGTMPEEQRTTPGTAR